MRPDRILVINRARDTDRLAAFDARWQAATGGAGYEVVTADDRPEDPTLGLYLSHLGALGSGPGPVLVFEDDAAFTPTFRLDLPEPPRGWFLLRLGGMLRSVGLPLGAPPGLAAGGWGPWLPVGIAHQTHAYVAARPDLLAAMVRARPTTDIGAALMFGLPGHWRLEPGTVGQAAGASTIAADRDRPADTFW